MRNLKRYTVWEDGDMPGVEVWWRNSLTFSVRVNDDEVDAFTAGDEQPGDVEWAEDHAAGYFDRLEAGEVAW